MNAFANFCFGRGFTTCASAISGIGDCSGGAVTCAAGTALPKSARRICSSVKSVFMWFLVGRDVAGVILALRDAVRMLGLPSNCALLKGVKPAWVPGELTL